MLGAGNNFTFVFFTIFNKSFVICFHSCLEVFFFILFIYLLYLFCCKQLFADKNIFYAIFIWCYYLVENELNGVDEIVQIIFYVGSVFFALHIFAAQCKKLAFHFLDLFCYFFSCLFFFQNVLDNLLNTFFQCLQ